MFTVYLYVLNDLLFFQPKDLFFLRIEADPCQFMLYDSRIEEDGIITIEEVRDVFPNTRFADKLFSALDTDGMQYYPCTYTIILLTKKFRNGPITGPKAAILVRALVAFDLLLGQYEIS